jgi:hypothetical protein
MKQRLIGISIAATMAITAPAWAQTPWFGTSQPQRPAAGYADPNLYRFVAPTPEDAYRQGLINRWELEQFDGPTPQALQGPNPNGSRSEPQ